MMLGGEPAAGVAPTDMAAIVMLADPFQALDGALAVEAVQGLPGIGRPVGERQRQVVAAIATVAAQFPRSQADVVAKGVVETPQAAKTAGVGDLGDGQPGLMQQLLGEQALAMQRIGLG